MVLSKMNRYSSSQLMVLTFCFSLLIPLGASRADDRKENAKASSKDHYKQIEAAVIAGKITQEEAQAKLNALKNQRSSKGKAIRESGDKKTIVHIESIWADLQSLVAAGKMSQEEANAVMSTIKQKVNAKDSANKKANSKPSPKDLYKQLESAVIAGKITKEEAQAKLAASKKEAYRENRVKAAAKPKAPPKDIYKQIEAAVIAGKITKEEAQTKLKALQPTDSTEKKSKGLEKKEASKPEQGKAATEANLKKVWAELQDAVAAGKMTKEQAIAKMAAIKKAKQGGK